MELMQASRQWSQRPDDERYLSMTDMLNDMLSQRRMSKDAVFSTNQLTVVPDGNHGLGIAGPTGNVANFTNWSFGQLASQISTPAEYMRRLPAPLAADCMNYGMKIIGEERDTKLLLKKNGELVARAFTGPNYGRVWNADIVGKLVDRFGDGINGEWRVPGEFGQQVTITKKNTTLYASDRDMFVFLANEDARVRVPNRRMGQDGTLSRGFFVWNSEVGSQTLGVATFLFDYVCSNRIVWGAQDYSEIRIRHSRNAPERFLEEVCPQLDRYAHVSAKVEEQKIIEAQQHKFDDEQKLQSFLATRFSKSVANNIQMAHLQEEGRPIETMWDAVTGATAYAKSIPYQNERIKIEREAGSWL